jgi:hypothetical protein
MKRNILLPLAIAVLVTSCHHQEIIDLCGVQQDINVGLIEEVLDIRCPYVEGETYVIEDQAAYEEIVGSCTEEELPAIDFDRHTLLGLTTGATGCDRYYWRSVYAQPGRQRYLYTVEITECGGCEPWVVRTHWVVVPKVPDEYDVKFLIRRPSN